MKSFFSSITQLVPVLVIMVSSAVSFGQDPLTVQILAIEGKVEVRRQTGGQPLIQPLALPVAIVVKPQDLLFPEDIIITGRNGRLVLALSDGSQVVIAPKRTIKVDNLTESPRNLINIIKGKARLQIERLGGKPNPYRVNTPTTIIAVRGTVFDVVVEDEKTDVYLHEGAVAVSNRQFPDQPLLLSPGSYTRVQPGGVPRLPIEFGEGQNDRNFRLKSRLPGVRPTPPSSAGRSPGTPEPSGQQNIDRSSSRTDGISNRPSTSVNGRNGGADGLGGGGIHSPSPTGSSRPRSGSRP